MSLIVRRNGLCILAILGMGVVALVIAQGQGWLINRDWFTYWGGARGLLDGRNLYFPPDWAQITFGYGSTWLPDRIFNYAPPTAIFFTPLAALSVQVASVIWLWLTEFFVAAAVVMIARDLRWERLKRYAPFWAMGFLFFMPLLLTMLMGQAPAVILLAVTACAFLWDRGKWFQGGLIIGITLVKPQPVILLLPLLGVWLLVHRRWSGLAGMAVSLGVNALASLLIFPNFLSDWTTTAANKVGGVAPRMPTVWGVGSLLFGDSPLAFWTAALAASLIFLAGLVLIVQWKSADALSISSVLLIASLLIPPYMWSYDQILLILPLVVALIRLEQRRHSFWLIALLPLGIDVAAIILFVLAAIRLQETTTVLLPVMTGLLLWFAYGETRRVAVRELS